MPIFRLPEFVIGICLQRITWQGRRANALLLTATISLILALAVTQDSGIYVTSNWFVVPLISAIILSSTRCTGWLADILSSDAMVALGKVSYCFYSFQFFVLLVGAQVYRKLGLTSHLVIFFACLSALLLISFAGHRFVEEPVRRWIQRRAARTALPRTASKSLA